jgi:hypothetical protein
VDLDKSRFDASLRKNNIKRVIMLLEDFYTGFYKRTVTLKTFDIDAMTTQVKSEPLLLLLHLGKTSLI